MKKIYIFVALITIAILSWSCDCIVDNDKIDPDKIIITPKDFANVLFINANHISDFEVLWVFSPNSYLKHLDTILYSKEYKDRIFEDQYVRVGIKTAGGLNSISIVQPPPYDTTILYSSNIKLKKGSSYTFIAYGIGDVQSLMVEDTINNFIEDNIYLRCFNVSANAPLITINISTEGYNKDFKLKSGQASELSALPSGTYTIKITSSDFQYSKTYYNVKFDKGMMNNFFFNGKYSENVCSIVSAKYPG